MKKIIENLILGIMTAAILAGSPVLAFSQYRLPPTEKPEIAGHAQKGDPPSMPIIFGGDTSEKSIKVDSNVNLSLCVTQGTVKVNGWNRNEVRVFVQNGSKFGFKVLQKSAKTGDPVWIMVTGVETKNKYAAPSECIGGGEIEIDLPTGATVNIKGKETTTTIDTVKKANVKTIGGDISLRNIAAGVMASTYEGDITVENAEGAMMLESTTGNIVVFEAGPSEIGDIFKARTNSGAISLQRLEHRQIDVGSISGSVIFNGEILSGGSYSLSTSNGSIRLSVPQNSSCKISATYSFGSFSSDIPFKVLTETITDGPVKNMVMAFGTGGDATLKLTTNNGSISIKKQ